MDPTFVDTLIVGASAAGLATAACLKRAGLPFEILEQSAQVATPWRNHYERLHLHTSKSLSNLPYLPFPQAADRYPAREKVVEYLDAYARHFELKPRFGVRVTSISRGENGWLTQTETGSYSSRNLVMATGYARVPNKPAWPGQEKFAGQIIHSSEYKNGKSLSGRRALVVGIGNSGGEIAIDLVEHGAKPTISVRSPINVVPRDFLGIPILAWGIVLDKLPTAIADGVANLVSRITIGNLEPLGLRRLGVGPMRQIGSSARIPLLDIGTIAHIRQGNLGVIAGFESFTANGVVTRDGKEHPFDAVILATGYRPGLQSLFTGVPDLLDDKGLPPKSGAETLPGLYFCGFRVAPTGMLREIAIEAMRISKSIAARPAKLLAS